MKKNIKTLLTESLMNLYESKLTKFIGDGPNELVSVFREYNKLTTDIMEDSLYITELYNLLNEDVNFDVYSHLEKTGKIDVEDDCVLSISEPNSKLGQINAASLALPAGYTCPFANKCKSMAHKKGGKFPDGSSIKDLGDIRCFAATGEMVSPNARRNRWRNFDLLKDTYKKEGISGMVDLILRSLENYEYNKGKLKLFRIHDSGDFYSQEYLDAWIGAAKARPDVLFYAYTKSLSFWKERKGEIPKNLRLIASEGGKQDKLISKEGFRKAVIVKDEGEAIERNLNIDVNDFLAAFGDKDFALLLHGTQSAESGNTKLARANSQKIKQVAKTLSVPESKINALLKYYTS